MAIFTAIASLGSMAGSWTLFGSAALFQAAKQAVVVGVTSLAQRLAGRRPSGPSFSVQGQLQRGADLPQSFVFGRAATAGSLVYANTWGHAGRTPNAYLTMVIALSDLPIQSLDRLWVDGKKCTFGNNPHASYGVPVSEYNRGGQDHLWVKFYDGSQQSADQFLVSTVSSPERRWSGDAVGRGTAYAIVTALVNQDLFKGFPECLFEVTGAPLYDPSRDSSVGGTGAQRWDNPSTWGGDGDHLVAVQIYNLFRGMRFEGDWVYGMQSCDPAQLPVAHWIGQIEACRASIAADGGAEPLYRSGGEISVGGAVVDALSVLLDACNGRISEAGGTYKLFIGGAGASVAEITDDDILSSEEQSFTPFLGLSDTVNGVAGTFPDPDQGWQVEAAPPIHNPGLEAEDGNRRLLVDVSFDLVPYPEQVQRLMRGALNEARRARRHTFALPPEFSLLEAGDVISYVSARNGYQRKLFRVDGGADLPTNDFVVDLTEVDPSDYDFQTDTDYVPVSGGGVSAPSIAPQVIAGWSVAAGAAPDASGAGRYPAISVAWDGTVEDVAAVLIRVRLKSTEAVIFSGRHDDVSVGQALIASGIAPDTEYEVQGRFLPASPRETLWSDWLTVKTLDLRARFQDLDMASFSEQGLAVFGHAVASANFDGSFDADGVLTGRGTRGWVLTQDGVGVFTGLIAREDIQVGAVSEGVTYSADTPQNIANGSELFHFDLGPFDLGQFWQIACSLRWRSAGYVGSTDDDRYRVRRWSTGAWLQWRTAVGNSWGGWQTLHTFAGTASTSWQEQNVVVSKQGKYSAVQVRCVVFSSLGTEGSGGDGSSATFENIDDTALVARAIVR